VNAWTVDLGQAGRAALELFLSRGAQSGFSPPVAALEYAP